MSSYKCRIILEGVTISNEYNLSNKEGNQFFPDIAASVNTQLYYSYHID